MQKIALFNWKTCLLFSETAKMRKPPQPSHTLTKILPVMKLTIILITVGLLHAHGEGHSQNITFTGKGVVLSKIFTVVETQTGYTFFANKDLLKGSRPVSVSVKDMPLKDFLDLAFHDQPMTYEINNKTIFIKRRSSSTSYAVSGMQKQPQAQQEQALQEISGTVSGADGVPLEGATIIVKGTKTATTSGANGAFSINANLTETLVISYVGYATVEERIHGRTNISIIMNKVISEVEQVVITALGIPKKTKALTYNVQEIKGDEVNKVKDANFVNSLSGRVAGVTINSSSSGIGGSTRVIMRGAKSLFGNNTALYVVDGVPLPGLNTAQPADLFQGAGVTGDGISNINPEDITSISVLTGPRWSSLVW